MRFKKFTYIALAALVTLTVSVTAFAAPYQNYTITESGFYPEPQAYVPDTVIDSGTIGVENLEGTPLNNPQDMKQFDYNGCIVISDTDNNRIVILEEDMRTVKQIIKNWDNNGEADGFSSPNGVDFYDEEHMLYVCDTGNRRIVRFTFDTETEMFGFDRTFDDPDISQYFSKTYDPNAATGEEPEATPAAEATDENEEAGTTENTGTAENTENTENTEGADEEINTDENTGTSSVSDITYKPLKIVIDHSMRMFVVSKDCYQGLVELDKDGNFTKFFGATKTKQTLSSLLNRLFTAKAKELLQQNLSTEYSNVALDAEGFVYGTVSQLAVEDLKSHFTSKSEVGAALRKLNAAGSDVLQRQGIIPPSGDEGDGANRSTYSYIVDVAVSENGLSSILDSQKGRVFTYTSTGELLYVFGALGQRLTATGEELDTDTREEQVGFTKGTSLSPTAIELLLDDETIVILDSDGAQMTTYIPTEYGLILREAVNSHEERRYEDAVESWNKILGMSSNSSLAYRGVGKVLYMNAAEELDSDKQRQGYLDAADYFMKGYSQQEYGKAFYKYRDKVLEEIMPYLMTGIVVIAVAAILFGWYKKFKKFIKTGGRPE